MASIIKRGIERCDRNLVSNITRKRRMKNMLLVIVAAYLLLILKLAYIQFIQGDELKTMAYVQQTLDRTINPNRGTIYDRNGEVLAMSASVETITVNPTNIVKEDKEKVAKALSNIFELDYETVLKKVSKKTSIETIVKKVDKEKTNELRKWMQSENIINGINIDEDTKRYYPFGTLASHIIGFTGSDNQGLDGIEAKYDETLSGQKGKIERKTDASGRVIGDGEEEYVKAIDGDSLELSIDANIQSIVTKYLEEACIDNECEEGRSCNYYGTKNWRYTSNGCISGIQSKRPIYNKHRGNHKCLESDFLNLIKTRHYKRCGEIKQLQILMSRDQLLNL